MNNTALVATPTTRWAVLIDPYFEFAPFSVGAGSTTYRNLIATVSQNRIQANGTAYVVNAASGETGYRHSTLTWDGTTAGVTNLQNRGSGAFALTFENNAGFMAAKIVATNANSDVRLVTYLQGSIEIGA
jgi:hypothetical protein